MFRRGNQRGATGDGPVHLWPGYHHREHGWLGLNAVQALARIGVALCLAITATGCIGAKLTYREDPPQVSVIYFSCLKTVNLDEITWGSFDARRLRSTGDTNGISAAANGAAKALVNP